MALPEHAPHLAPRLVLGDAHDDHEGDHVVEQDGEQSVLVVLQTLPLSLTQRVVSAPQESIQPSTDTKRPGDLQQIEVRNCLVNATTP